VLIDLGAAELLDAWFSLEIETVDDLSRLAGSHTPHAESEAAPVCSRRQDSGCRNRLEAMSEVVRLKLDLPRSVTACKMVGLDLAMKREACSDR